MHFAHIDNGFGAHPHNFWLQVAAEWGLPAFVVIALATGSLFLKLWRTARLDDANAALAKQPLLAASLLAALSAWIVGTQFDGYMVVPTSQAMSAVILMLCTAFCRLDIYQHRQSIKASSGWLGTAPLCIGALAVLSLATLPLTPFGQPTEREERWRAENPIASLWPRFWQQGWIGPDADPTARELLKER